MLGKFELGRGLHDGCEKTLAVIGAGWHLKVGGGWGVLSPRFISLYEFPHLVKSPIWISSVQVQGNHVEACGSIETWGVGSIEGIGV